MGWLSVSGRCRVAFPPDYMTTPGQSAQGKLDTASLIQLILILLVTDLHRRSIGDKVYLQAVIIGCDF